jgi:hypothetical protein
VVEAHPLRSKRIPDQKLDNSAQPGAAQSVLLPAAFAFFHLALAAAAIFTRAAALIFRMAFLPDVSILDRSAGLGMQGVRTAPDATHRRPGYAHPVCD